jgi:ADP-ribosylglycohydrolase
MRISKEYFRGCLLGGAIGDALGWPVEFLLDSEIKMKYGERGVTNLILGQKGIAEVTDDTQMTLFTGEGLLVATEGGISSDVISYVYGAYLAWLYTQGEYDKKEDLSKYWLLNKKELFVKRAPGFTCIESLKSGSMGTIQNPINSSKGCGGVMRVAPVGLMFQSRKAFQIACECAAITHGHPSGYISAGIFACIIAEIILGKDLAQSVNIALDIAKEYNGHQECMVAIQKALSFAPKDIDTKSAIKQIGEGWVGEEALAIALYCSLKYKDEFDRAIIAAINHDGDSDSTGAITGNILGAYCGVQKIPKRWIEKLELLEVITEIADDIYEYRKASYYNLF